MTGTHVCRHSEGGWNSVSGYQFGEQTATMTGKGGLEGITLSSELVTEWIDSFPLSVYISYAMEHMYSQADQLPNSSSSQTKHKEEGICDGSLNLRKGDTFVRTCQAFPPIDSPKRSPLQHCQWSVRSCGCQCR